MQRLFVVICLIIIGTIGIGNVAGYRCQETMSAYFHIMTAGNYSLLPTILNENVVWTIPGGVGVLPFNGVFQGPDAVVGWAKTINDSLDMYLNDEFGEVNTDNEGHISLHDEAIVVRKNGRYYRAAVAHEWHFDDNCKVTIFNGYYDSMVATVAYYGGVPYSYPIPNTGPPVYGVDQVPSSLARSIVTKYYQGQFGVLADNVTAFVPGNPEEFPFAGVYLDSESFVNSFSSWTQMFNVISVNQSADMMVQNGAVATYTTYVLQSQKTLKQTTWNVCEHFLINWAGQIQRFTEYFDTYPLVSILQ